jgi:2-iminobutanoate/2-iminopropanoate deaminase
MEAIQAILKEAGCDLSDVVKTTCYLSDRAFHNEFDEAYGKFWPNGDYPTRCTFVVGIGGNCRVEIDAVAVKRRR